MNAKQAAEMRVVQAREDWELRALKLQLLHPDMFAVVAGCLMGAAPQRAHSMRIFRTLQSMDILEQLDFGAITEYRIGLFTKACRKHMRDCTHSRGGSRGRKLETQGVSQASSP